MFEMTIRFNKIWLNFFKIKKLNWTKI